MNEKVAIIDKPGLYPGYNIQSKSMYCIPKSSFSIFSIFNPIDFSMLSFALCVPSWVMDISLGLRVAVIRDVASGVMHVGLSHWEHQARLWKTMCHSIYSVKDKYKASCGYVHT